MSNLHDAPLPVLMAFSAPWCEPCKTMHATVEALAKEYEGVLSLLELDATKEHGMVATFKIQSVPTYILVKDGQEVGRVLGANKEALKALFKRGTVKSA